MTRVVTVAEDNYDDNYFKIHLDVLPETMKHQDLQNLTNVRTCACVFAYT